MKLRLPNFLFPSHEKFVTDYRYIDRQTKAKYVWEKYKRILTGRILDVGADECYLKSYLSSETFYWGIGLGGNPDQQVNLERERIPFDDDSFDCVLCLDVLEHLDNIHDVFDELCRVSRAYVIISLPNPWSSFYSMLFEKDYRPEQPLKFYGLPCEPPEDRHKWFFSPEEAEQFIRFRAKRNTMKIVQLDYEPGGNPEAVHKLRPDLNLSNLVAGPQWTVLLKGDNTHK